MLKSSLPALAVILLSSACGVGQMQLVTDDFAQTPFTTTRTALAEDHGATENKLESPAGVSPKLTVACLDTGGDSDRGTRCYTFVDGKMFRRQTSHLVVNSGAVALWSDFLKGAAGINGAPKPKLLFRATAKKCAVTQREGSVVPADPKATRFESVDHPSARVALEAGELCGWAEYGGALKSVVVRLYKSPVSSGMYSVNYFDYSPDAAMHAAHKASKKAMLDHMGKKLDAIREKVDAL